jgi:hypothetical protein
MQMRTHGWRTVPSKLWFRLLLAWTAPSRSPSESCMPERAQSAPYTARRHSPASSGTRRLKSPDPMPKPIPGSGKKPPPVDQRPFCRRASRSRLPASCRLVKRPQSSFAHPGPHATQLRNDLRSHVFPSDAAGMTINEDPERKAAIPVLLIGENVVQGCMIGHTRASENVDGSALVREVRQAEILRRGVTRRRRCPPAISPSPA